MTDSLPFESALQQLQSIVEKMEHGSLSLEASLAAFEDGIRLSRDCQRALQEAEQKVLVLTQKQEGDSLTPFQTDAVRGN